MRSFPLIALLGVLCLCPMRSPQPQAAVDVQPVRIVTRQERQAEFIHRLAQVTFDPKPGESWDFSAKAIYEYTGFQQDAPKKLEDKPRYHRGRKQPTEAVLQARHAAAFARHGHRMRGLPKATPDKYDLRTLNRTSPMQDQGQCGSCWDVSTCGVVTDAFIANGTFQAGDASIILSPQYVLDCGNNGGCNGDDAPTVLDMAKNKGLPTTKDYGPYLARPSRCNTNVTKYWQIKDWGFCTPSQQQGVASTQDIKNALVQYGTISTAVAADSSWDNPAADGTLPYSNSDSIDHDVAIIGWDDSHVVPGAKSPGAWIMKNQWGTSWGNQGYGWLGYGSHSIGTEAAWASAGAVPPPQPVPPGPGPTPPVPPGPTPPTPTPGTTPTVVFAGTNTTLDGVTFELAPMGTGALILNTKASVDALYNAMYPQPVTPPSPCGKEDKRWEAQDKTNKAMLDALIAIQKQLTLGKP